MKLLYGEEKYLIDKYIKNLSINVDNALFFNENHTTEEIFMSISSFSLFDIGKYIVIQDHSIFNDENSMKLLLSMIEKNNLNEYIIFVINGQKPKKSYLFDFCQKNNTELCEFQSLKSNKLIDFVQKYCASKEAKINNKCTTLLLEKLPNNLFIITSEIDKIIFQTKEITEKSIKENASNYLEDDFFLLTNSLINNNVSSFLKNYHLKKQLGFEPTFLISQISSALSVALLIDSYKNLGFSLLEISNKTKINIYRLKKINNIFNSRTIPEIKSFIKELSILDYKIKTGQLDPKYGLDFLVLKMIK